MDNVTTHIAVPDNVPIVDGEPWKSEYAIFAEDFSDDVAYVMTGRKIANAHDVNLINAAPNLFIIIIELLSKHGCGSEETACDVCKRARAFLQAARPSEERKAE